MIPLPWVVLLLVCCACEVSVSCGVESTPTHEGTTEEEPHVEEHSEQNPTYYV